MMVKWPKYKKLLIVIVSSNILISCFDLERAHIPEMPECAKCTQAECASEYASCMDSGSCRSRYECLIKCDFDDPDCRIKCPGHPIRNDQTALELDICKSAKCMPVCDKCGASIFDERGAACSLCLQKQDCCKASTACALNAECSQTMRARYSCDDPFCAMNDGLSYDGNRQRLNSVERTELESCLEKCATECRLGTDYSCYRAYTAPPPGADPLTTSVTLVPRDMWNGKIIEHVKMQALEIDADTPELDLKPNEDGEFVFTHTGEYKGFFRSEKDGYLPTRMYFNRVLLGNEHWGVLHVPDTIAASFELLTGQPINVEDYGVLVVTAHDCTHTFARGLQMNYLPEQVENSSIRKIYVAEDITKTDLTATGEQGTAVYVNVPEGESVLHITLEDTNEPIGMMDIKVVKGEVTWAVTFPTQHLWGGS